MCSIYKCSFSRSSITRNGVLFLLSTCIMALVSAVFSSAGILVLHIIVSLAGNLLSNNNEEVKIFYTTYIFNIFIVLMIFSVYTIRYDRPYYIGGSDDLLFESLGREIAKSTNISGYGNAKDIAYGHLYDAHGYAYLVSLLYRLGEVVGQFHTLMPRFFNSGALAVISVIVFRYSSKVLKIPGSYSYFSSILLGLSPLATYISAHTYRDTIVSLLLLAPVYCLHRSHFSLRSLLFTVVCFFVLLEFRVFSAVALAAISLVILFTASSSIKAVNKVKTHFAGGVVICVVLYYGYVYRSFLIEKIGKIYINYATLRGEDLSSGLAAYVFSAPEPLSSLMRIFYYSVNPLPIPTYEIERNWLKLGSILHFLFIPFALHGIYRLSKSKKMLPVPILFAMLFVGDAIFAFSTRHMIMFYPFAIMTTAVGYHDYIKKGGYPRKLISFMLLLFVMLGCVYLVISR